MCNSVCLFGVTCAQMCSSRTLWHWWKWLNSDLFPEIQCGGATGRQIISTTEQNPTASPQKRYDALTYIQLGEKKIKNHRGPPAVSNWVKVRSPNILPEKPYHPTHQTSRSFVQRTDQLQRGQISTSSFSISGTQKSTAKLQKLRLAGEKKQKDL